MRGGEGVDRKERRRDRGGLLCDIVGHRKPGERYMKSNIAHRMSANKVLRNDVLLAYRPANEFAYAAIKSARLYKNSS